MRILWITNIPLPPICQALGFNSLPVGGWMYSSLKKIKQSGDIFAVATIYSGNEIIHKNIEGIDWYLLPLNGKSSFSYHKTLEHYWVKINNDFKPNIIHIHGTEFPHGLAYIRACGNEGVVISIQGLISVYARYYYIQDEYSWQKLITFRDFVKSDSITKRRHEFIKRGKLEVEMLKGVKHIIGRTEWDKAHTNAINPHASYHYCGETLRDSFYINTWSYDHCKPYSIFVSQGTYPIKGLHKMLDAMPYILRKYPNCHLYIAGSDITRTPWYKMSAYAKYIKLKIKDLTLSDNITFTGTLNEKAMCQQYLKSNVFVCPSAIENSPNSLGEAQMLGMPYVCSYVGGIPELVDYNEATLYRYEESEMLAEKICQIFSLKDQFKCNVFDKDRYDSELNSSILVSIYRKILVDK